MPNPQQPRTNPPIVDVDTNFTTNRVDTSHPNTFPKGLDQTSGLFVQPADMYCNHSKRECVTGIHRVMPSDMVELKKNIQDSIKNNRNLRAVGHGCSYSDISMVNKGTIVETTDLDGIDDDWDMQLLTPQASHTKKEYISIKSGTHISELNMLLDSQQKAMIILGGGDVQTLGGVISTSTHGSGFTYGAIGDYVQSIVLVNESGIVYRIERSNGITDAAKYALRTNSYGAILQQDDHIFNAVLVSMGCMGVIYSVVIEVKKAFKLYEDKTLKTWGDIKRLLFAHNPPMPDCPYVEFAINPYAHDGNTEVNERTCCLTSLKETTENPRGNSGMRKLLYVMGSALNITPNLVYGYLKTHPTQVPTVMSGALKQIVDDVLGVGKGYIDKSYNVFNKRLGSLVENGVGIEAVVEWEQGVAVLELVMAKLQELACGFDRSKGCRYLTSPISIRFVKASTAYLSMFYHPTPEKVFMVMEIPVISFEKLIHDDSSYKEDVQILVDLQHFLMEDPINARIHWGLSFKEHINQSYAEKTYEKYADFKMVYQKLNPKGGFKNDFTSRLGLDLPVQIHSDPPIV